VRERGNQTNQTNKPKIHESFHHIVRRSAAAWPRIERRGFYARQTSGATP
jgi:hypothetical protein